MSTQILAIQIYKTIFMDILTTYRYITPETIGEQKEDVYAKGSDIQQPLIIMFDEIDELKQDTIATSNSYTATEMINIEINPLSNFNDFDKELTSWFERPSIHNTLPSFKAYFERECQALKKVSGTTFMNTSYFQQANDMKSVLDNLKQERVEMIQEVKTTEIKCWEPYKCLRMIFNKIESIETTLKKLNLLSKKQILLPLMLSRLKY